MLHVFSPTEFAVVSYDAEKQARPTPPPRTTIKLTIDADVFETFCNIVSYQAVHHGTHSHVDHELHLGARPHVAQEMRSLAHGAVHRSLCTLEQPLVATAQENQGALWYREGRREPND